MIRKWLVFAVSAGFLISLGVGVGLSTAQEEKKGGPLENVMEQVQKNYLAITKGTRNAVFFKKSQKDVEKSAKELVKLAKQAKPVKHYLKNAKNVSDPAKKWEELVDNLIKSSEKLGEVAGKPAATHAEAKSAFADVKKVCTECHNDFRIDENF
jgi:cytochrome c556